MFFPLLNRRISALLGSKGTLLQTQLHLAKDFPNVPTVIFNKGYAADQLSNPK
jgi:hypothetical protein